MRHPSPGKRRGTPILIIFCRGRFDRGTISEIAKAEGEFSRQIHFLFPPVGDARSGAAIPTGPLIHISRHYRGKFPGKLFQFGINNSDELIAFFRREHARAKSVRHVIRDGGGRDGIFRLRASAPATDAAEDAEGTRPTWISKWRLKREALQGGGGIFRESRGTASSEMPAKDHTALAGRAEALRGARPAFNINRNRFLQLACRRAHVGIANFSNKKKKALPSYLRLIDLFPIRSGCAAPVRKHPPHPTTSS